MNHVGSALSDGTLTAWLYIDNVLFGILGLYVSFKPPKAGLSSIRKETVARFLLFLVLVISGLLLTKEQSRRQAVQADVSRRQHDDDVRSRQAEHETDVRSRQAEFIKMDNINGVIDRLAFDVKLEIFKNAAAQIRAIREQGTEISSRSVAQNAAGSQSSATSLLDRAISMNKELQGLLQDWNAKDDAMEVNIKRRWSQPLYTNRSPQDREVYMESDLREISFRQLEINRQESTFYRDNYEKEASMIRSEIISKVPGVGDTSIDYSNNRAPKDSYVGFSAISGDFESLTRAYSAREQ